MSKKLLLTKFRIILLLALLFYILWWGYLFINILSISDKISTYSSRNQNLSFSSSIKNDNIKKYFHSDFKPIEIVELNSDFVNNENDFIYIYLSLFEVKKIEQKFGRISLIFDVKNDS